MEYTAQQAAEAARNIGVDLEGEKIRPEALAAGMAGEAARHGTKDAATNIVAEDPVIAAKLALANLRVSPNYYSPKAGVTAWEKSLARGAKQQGRKTEYKTLLFNVDDYDEEQGIFSGYGSVFVLGENAGDFTDFNTVVYGHNMLDGRMFAQLHRFRDKNFFDSHGQIIVYTPERQLTYQVFAAYRRDNLDIIANTDFSTKALIDEYIESVYAQTDLAQFNPALEVTSSDRIITLSTCIGNPAYRFVVQGVLVDEAQAVFAGTPDADGE